MNPKTLGTRVRSTAGWALKTYLILFMFGCTPRPDALPVDEARALGTRTLEGTPEQVVKSTVAILQDMHYSIDVVDRDLGLISASKRTQQREGRIAREPQPLHDDPTAPTEAETFCFIASIFALTFLWMSWLFDLDFWNNDDDVDINPIIIDNDWDNDYRSGASYYEYKVTVNLEELGMDQTSVRLSILGSHFDDGVLQATGPVQTAALYDDFFLKLRTAVNALP